MQPVADRLGKLLADSIEMFAASAEVPRQMLVVPVPMHAAKQRQRGFNQAELLARAAIRETRRRHPEAELRFKTDLLKRERVTVSQAGLFDPSAPPESARRFFCRLIPGVSPGSMFC